MAYWKIYWHNFNKVFVAATDFSKISFMQFKILIIDDEQTMRLTMRNFFADTYEVTCKADGIEALDWLEKNTVDVIICDNHMPNMDGIHFLEKLRLRGLSKHIPTIIMLSTESSQERVTLYQKGAQDLLLKPYNPEELGELIKKNISPIHFADKW